MGNGFLTLVEFTEDADGSSQRNNKIGRRRESR